MYGAADMLRIMQQQGKKDNPPTMQLGTMTGYNTCMLGDELELEETQLYFFERDTFRVARTCRPMIKGHVSQIPTEEDPYIMFENEEEDWDRNIYTDPYEEDDIVALIRMPDGRYLVLGKVIAGEDVEELEDKIEYDWALDDSGEESEEEEEE